MDDDRVGYTSTWTVDWTTELCGHMERYWWRLQSGSSQVLRTTKSLTYTRMKNFFELKTSLCISRFIIFIILWFNRVWVI